MEKKDKIKTNDIIENKELNEEFVPPNHPRAMNLRWPLYCNNAPCHCVRSRALIQELCQITKVLKSQQWDDKMDI